MPVNRSWSFGQVPLSQLPGQPDFSQPGTSGYRPPGHHPPAVTTSYDPPAMRHHYHQSPYVPGWQASSPVHLLPPRSPSPTYQALETPENPLSLTGLVREHLERMSDDVTNTQHHGKK